MTDNPSDREIQDFFDSLNPSDFARETSAVATELLEAKQSGAAAFVRFLDAMISSTTSSFNGQTPQDPWQTTAVLQLSDTRRFFTPDDDETNQMFISRLHREAMELKAQWFFIAMVGPVAFYRSVEETVAPGNHEIEAVMWYAEAHEPNFKHVRQGMISIDGNRCGINYEGDPEGAADLFKEVLPRIAL